MKKNNIIVIGLTLLILAGIGLWVSNRSHTSGNSDKIRIAANLPMTGQLGYYGVAVQEGAMMALEEAKARPDSGLERVTIDWQDNGSDPKVAVTVLQKQALNDPAIYVSGVKPQTMAIKDEVTRLGLPHFVYIFDAFINSGSSNNLRTWLSYKIEPPVYLGYVHRRQAKKIAISYVRLPHSTEEFEKIILPALQKEGIETTVESFDFGHTDFKDIAAKLAATKPDLYILNGFQDDLVGMIRSLRPLSAITDGNVICTYDLLDASKVLGPDEIEGVRLVAPLFETRPAESGIAEWRARFQAKYKKPPFYTHAFAFDMMSAIGAAAKSQPTPKTHEEWLKALRAVDIQGITGSIRFDADGDMVTPLEVGVYRNGKLIPDSNGK